MEYVSAGGNRHPAASCWYEDSLYYGADNNIAIWQPQKGSKGVTTLLVGHTDTVNAIQHLPGLLISGSVDKTIRIWRAIPGLQLEYECIQVLETHQSSINCIAVTDGASIFATGAADTTVNIWRVGDATAEKPVEFVQSIALKPRFFPLALALSALDASGDSYVLAVAGTTAIAQLYTSDSSDKDFQLKATLSGHEGWIRSLAFTRETTDPQSDLLLASASQDKYIRLWRIHQGTELSVSAAVGNDPALNSFMPGKSLSNKAHRFTASDLAYIATFEALLLGHEDWIYTAKWNRLNDKLQLLSASADNSLAIWESDPDSGVWVSVARLGEISAQKGSTTATGSTGGFWTGLFSPDGQTVVCLGRTGSWRIWNWNAQESRWLPGSGINGHIASVTGLSWSQDGSYLLTTSADQTTRLHSPWVREGREPTWHELSRPQIHGYDLNCISTLGPTSFVSGAEEKLLRVFTIPGSVATALNTVSGISLPKLATDASALPDAANMPVLGLSNKAVEAVDDSTPLPESSPHTFDNSETSAPIHKSSLIISSPPIEDHLSRYTLWPEVEKLYGHGYEISCLATSHDGKIIATACKASSIDHAVIRLFETEKWTEVKPPLTAHNLTVTSLTFSRNDKYLLSVGRDRQWGLYEREQDSHTNYKVVKIEPKGHLRMILDAAWMPSSYAGVGFVTAGRDKSVKFWNSHTCIQTIHEDSPVTAVDIADNNDSESGIWLAVGTEAGTLNIYEIEPALLHVRRKIVVSKRFCPSKAITQLAWRPRSADQTDQEGQELAVASEDSSLRLLSLKGILSATK